MPSGTTIRNLKAVSINNQITDWVRDNWATVLETLEKSFPTSSWTDAELQSIRIYDEEISLESINFILEAAYSYETVAMAETIIENPTGATITNTWTWEESSQNTFQFGFEESLKVGAKAKFEAKVPMIGGSEVELSVDVSFTANQQWTDTKTVSWGNTVEISVPPYTSIVARAFLDTATGDNLFTAIAVTTRASVRMYLDHPPAARFPHKVLDVPLALLDVPKVARIAPVSGNLQVGFSLNSFVRLEELI